jgi:hypothetical protein
LASGSRPVVTGETLAALGFALARTGLCAYRAATQSVVHDEAFTYLSFLQGSWHTVYFEFNANNHLLFSILTKLSIGIFGLSEFTLRLVSVLAGFFLTMGIYQVLREAKTGVAIRWTALLAIGAHPLLMDFSVAARGYSLALACLIWAIAFSMRGSNILTGFLLGLAASANLAVALPAAGLLLSRLAFSRGALRERVLAAWKATGPMIVVLAAVCWGAVRSMTPGQFVSAGLPTIRLSLDSLVWTSILATRNPGLLEYVSFKPFLQFVMIPVLMLVVAAAGLRMWRGSEEARARFQTAGALGFACAGMIAGHYLLKLNYPLDRTGLPFVVLAGLAWAIAISEFSNDWVTWVNVVFGLLLCVQFLTQFQAGQFQNWRYDRATKQVAEKLADETRGKPPASIRISATWIHQPALEFYRIHKNIAALQPIVRRNDIVLSGFDYYVLNAPDTQAPEVRRMEVLFSEPQAGVVLARSR